MRLKNSYKIKNGGNLRLRLYVDEDTIDFDLFNVFVASGTRGGHTSGLTVFGGHS